jgi:sec-independent protein translocase protein TatC
MHEERRLTIGEHLEELRGHVIRAVAYIGIALVICLIFQEPLLKVVLWPQQRIANEGRPERLASAAQELADILADVRARPLAERKPEERAGVAARFDHVLKLALGGPDPRLNAFSPQESFFSYLKVAFICALFLASPFFAVELWSFIAEGLHADEQRWAKIFGPISFGCFAAGALFGYFVLIPVSLEYLETYGSPELIVVQLRLDAYLDFFLGLTLAVGLIFEVPIVLVFLSLIHIVDSAKLVEYRKYFVLLATIIAAVVTPTGDPITLSIVAIPLLLLYELGIVGVKLIEKRTAIA